MRRIPLSIEVRKVLKLLMVTLSGMLIIGSVYYFTNMTDTAEKGYKLRENQLLQKELESKNKMLRQSVLEAQTLNEVKKSDVVSEMIEPASPIFIGPKGPLGKRK